MEQDKQNTIMVDGVERPRELSNGKLIAETDEDLTKFWQWFAGAKNVDEKGRPLAADEWLQKREDEMTLSPEDRASIEKYAHDLASGDHKWKTLLKVPVININGGGPVSAVPLKAETQEIDQSGRPLVFNGPSNVNLGPATPTDLDSLASRMTGSMIPSAKKDPGLKPK